MLIPGPGGFDTILGRELDRAERLKATVLAGVLAFTALLSSLLFALASDSFARLSERSEQRWLIIVALSPAILWELWVRWYVGRAIRGGRRVHRSLAWVTVTLEACVPTVALAFAARFIAPQAVLVAPPLLGYGILVAVTALRLEPKLSIWAGVVGAIGYVGLVAALMPADAGIRSEGVIYGARAALIVVTGLATAFVAGVLRKRIVDSVELWEERNAVIDMFGRYVTDEVVDLLLESPEGLRLGGEKRRLSLLMTDLRGFSVFSERLPPERLVTLLNHYLSVMTEVIEAHEGTINEFIGDAILVIFGAPVDQPDHADRALACAIAMQGAMGRVNDWNREHALPEIEMGIGVHTADVVVGNIGSERRLKYGVVGSGVNLTARIESYTVGGQILASAATADAIGGELRVRGEREVLPKGSSSPVRLLDIAGLDGVELAHLDDPVVDIEPVAVTFRVMKGKDLGGEAHAGQLLRLSRHEAVMRTEAPLSELANLVLAVGEGEAFAKVMDVGELVRIRFTARDETAKRVLDPLVSSPPDRG